MTTIYRDYEKFPDDENGDALWGMFQSGDNLSKAREIDFSVVFSTEEEALKFGEVLLQCHHKISMSDYKESYDYPYEITVYAYLEPNYENITKFEALLEKHAKELNGYNDGWGCFEQE